MSGGRLDLKNAGGWMASEGEDHDVVVTSRVRLARNIKGFPFKARLDEKKGHGLEEFLRDKLLSLPLFSDQAYVDLQSSESLDRELLLERHLVSVEHARGSGPRGVLFSGREYFSVMVNEEDHLRLQVIGPGMSIDSLSSRLSKVDQSIGASVDYCYHSQFGYLTSCPTNVGTGIRLSVMMHLPALVLSKEIEKTFNSAARMRLAVRGFYGEGTFYLGDFFQVSNQVTLGKSVPRLQQELSKVLPRIVDHERDVRRLVLQDRSFGLEDRVFRSYGLLRYARKLSSQEALDNLSRLRLGVCLGILKEVELKTVHELLVLSQPAHVQAIENREMSEEERDVARAEFIRTRLASPR